MALQPIVAFHDRRAHAYEALVRNEDHVRTLRQLGFEIAVDNLGAGDAGLSSLALLEPEVVKIDLSLVRNIDQHATKRGIRQSNYH